MDLTKDQVMGFIEAALGHAGKMRLASPLLVAWLEGAMPFRMRLPTKLISHLGGLPSCDNDRAEAEQEARKLAQVLFAICRVLWDKDDPVLAEDVAQCEACNWPCMEADANFARWRYDPEAGWLCPRCAKESKLEET